MGLDTRFHSRRQESAVAKKLNGRRQANSGATPFQKGDVITKDWLIECKTKVKDSTSFTIKHDWLSKNTEEAFAMGKQHSALCFDFGPDSERYYIISEKQFQALQKYLEEDK